MKTVREILMPVLALLVICTVTTALMAYTNSVTKDIITENEHKAMERAQKELLPQAASFTAKQAGDASVYYEARNAAGALEGYIFLTSAKGYGGDIRVMTALSADGAVRSTPFTSISTPPTTPRP